MITIELDEDYNTSIKKADLGYVGEEKSRTIMLKNYEIDGADRYIIRFLYDDGVLYDEDITSGVYNVTASIMRLTGYVRAQIVALKTDLDGESYIYVKKSSIFKLRIREALDGSVSEDDGGSSYDSLKLDVSKVKQDLQTKVDKVEGKGLSTNDFTDEYKTKISSNESDIFDVQAKLSTKVDKVEGKGLSTNDFTDELKAIYDKAVSELDDVVSTIGESNKINSISVNGFALPIDINKNVDISVPTSTDIENAITSKGYQTETQIDSKLSTKVDKVEGKGLSTNDFTDEYKTKISSNESDISTLKNKIDAKVTIEDVDSLIISKGYQTSSDVEEIISQNVHTHTNKPTLDKLDVNENGNLTYDGNEVGAGEALDAAVSRIEVLEMYMQYMSDMVYSGEIVAPVEVSSTENSVDILVDDNGSPIVGER